MRDHESQAWFDLNGRHWTTTGRKADLVLGLPLVAFLVCAGVGVVTIVRWIA